MLVPVVGRLRDHVENVMNADDFRFTVNNDNALVCAKCWQRLPITTYHHGVSPTEIRVIASVHVMSCTGVKYTNQVLDETLDD